MELLHTDGFMAKRDYGSVEVTVLAVLFGALSVLSLVLGIVIFIWPSYLSYFVSSASYFPPGLTAPALVIFGIVGIFTANGLRSLRLWAWIVTLVLLVTALSSGLLELQEKAFVYPIVGILRSAILIILIGYLFLILKRFRKG